MRITPAWAGKSETVCLLVLRRWDHPRVGGEKIFRFNWKEPHQGSPPRGRGKATVSATLTARQRITPAWAGKRRQTSGPCAARGDHPRVGGEKILAQTEQKRG